jgi:hypothetical protein
MKTETTERIKERRIRGVVRHERPRCGAKTRKGTPCKAQALQNGRCYIHGGLSTGPRTPEGKVRQAEAARKQMLERWARYRETGEKPKLSEEGRKRIAEAQRRRWSHWYAERGMLWKLATLYPDGSIRYPDGTILCPAD